MVETMITEIEGAFRSVLHNITWMDDVTKLKALTKLRFRAPTGACAARRLTRYAHSQVTRRVGSPTDPSYYPGCVSTRRTGPLCCD